MNVKWVKETHEVFANICLTLSVIHVCGVLLVDFQTRENLDRGMISGRKKTLDGRQGKSPRIVCGMGRDWNYQPISP